MKKNNKARRGVYRDSSLVKRFFAKVDIPKDCCWNWTGRKNYGRYGQVGKGEHIESAHRVAYMLFNGEIPEGLFVLHSCDNPSCVNPAHLRLGTDLDNTGDKIKRNRLNPVKGGDASWAKLTSLDVRKIRNIRDRKQLSYRKISEIWGVHKQTVCDICNRRTWKHVK